MELKIIGPIVPLEPSEDTSPDEDTSMMPVLFEADHTATSASDGLDIGALAALEVSRQEDEGMFLAGSPTAQLIDLPRFSGGASLTGMVVDASAICPDSPPGDSARLPAHRDAVPPPPPPTPKRSPQPRAPLTAVAVALVAVATVASVVISGS